MNANELMLENYVEFENQLHQVIGITKDKINLSRKSDSGKNNITYWAGICSVKPILLSEYWLKDLGFSYNNNWHYYLGINPLTKDYLIDICWIDGDESPFYRNGHFRIKHVNQLQNLHFALTGNLLQLVEPN